MSDELIADTGTNDKVSNERKNLNRLAGEFLVASRLTQRGYMVSLQWGTTIGYDILAFDKSGNVAFIEVKSSASYKRAWILQSKYATPERDAIDTSRRFICCVDLVTGQREPDVYIFPCTVVAQGMRYFFSGKFPNSPSYHLSLDKRPQGSGRNATCPTVGEHIVAHRYLEHYDGLGLTPVLR